MSRNKVKLTENDRKISRIITVDRVVKVTKGGRDFSYRALVVVGNQDGIIGYGVGKSKDLSESVSKAEENALKNLLKLSFFQNSPKKNIPHEEETHYSGARVFIRPASQGTGIIAGGTVRSVLEVAGLRNILSKCKGSSNAHNVVKATFNALSKMRDIKTISKERGISIQKLFKI